MHPVEETKKYQSLCYIVFTNVDDVEAPYTTADSGACFSILMRRTPDLVYFLLNILELTDYLFIQIKHRFGPINISVKTVFAVQFSFTGKVKDSKQAAKSIKQNSASN